MLLSSGTMGCPDLDALDRLDYITFMSLTALAASFVMAIARIMRVRSHSIKEIQSAAITVARVEETVPGRESITSDMHAAIFVLGGDTKALAMVGKVR